MLVLTSVSTSPLGLSARSTRCILYPQMENLCMLLRWVSWMQQTIFCALRNCWSSSFFRRTPSAFQCTIRSVWLPVALLCLPPGIRRGSEPQSVALVGPFWGWGPRAVPPWLRSTRTPQRSKDNCTAMLSLIWGQPIFYPRQVRCVIWFRRLRFLLRVASSPRIAALPSWRVHPTRQNGCVTCLVCWWVFWLLVTLHFQPSPLASKLLAAPRKREQSVSLSLPVHSLSTESPMQCLLVAAGVYGRRKAPEPNCKGEISMTQW